MDAQQEKMYAELLDLMIEHAKQVNSGQVPESLPEEPIGEPADIEDLDLESICEEIEEDEYASSKEHEVDWDSDDDDLPEDSDREDWRREFYGVQFEEEIEEEEDYIISDGD